MKKITIKLLTLLLAVVLVASSLSSCLDSIAPLPDREDISSNISASLEEDKKNFDRASKYYVFWQLPSFDADKMTYIEDIFESVYNYEDGLPDTLTHAAASANYFLENFYDGIDLRDEVAVTDALITSYIEVLDDPYAIYRVPEENDDYTLDMSGKFGGIGVTILYDDENQTVTVDSINVDSPAEKAGFRVGDMIYAVDGRLVSDIGYRNAVNYVRGDVGSTVTITVIRDGERVTLTATRAIVDDISVQCEITAEGYGYIRVSSFKDNTYSQFAKAIEEVKAAAVTGVIFDMRNNPGGYLDTVCDMLSYIIPSGKTIVTYEYAGNLFHEKKSKEDTNPLTNQKGDFTLDVPMVVICNRYTASAAEIFTAAIRDYRDEGMLSATVVGTTTYKKGIMQGTYIYKKDGSSVTLTTAYYNPPCGENYHGEGVAPDVTVENTATEDLQYNRALLELQMLINVNNN